MRFSVNKITAIKTKWNFWMAFVLSISHGGLVAEKFSVTNLSLLYGNGYKLGLEEKHLFTFEHADRHKYGENFFFFDVTNALGRQTTQLREEVQKLGAFEGVSGTITFSPGGAIEGIRWALYEWNGNSIKKISGDGSK